MAAPPPVADDSPNGPPQGAADRGRVRATVQRVLVTLVGFALVGAGVVMLVLPGPGIVVAVAGLVVLATEFDWARQLLDRTRHRAADAAAQLQERRSALALLVLSAAAMVVGGGVAAVVLDDHRVLGVGAVVAGLCSIAVVTPTVQRWLRGATDPDAD